MATDLSATYVVEPQPGTSKRHSLIRVALKQKKCTSKHSSTLHPDPFRYGNPNPLDCHPYYSDKHPYYIHGPQSAQEPLTFPVLNFTAGTGGLSTYGEDELDAYRVQGFVPRLLRVDSLTAIFEFFDRNTLSRAMANSPHAAERQTPERNNPEKITPAPSHIPIQLDSQIHIQGSNVGNVIALAKETREVKNMPKNGTVRQVPQSPKPLPSLLSNRRFPLESEPPIRYHPNAGLPRGWQRAHDCFIAYLDTHRPVSRGGSREQKRVEYTLDQMVYLLKQRFSVFEYVCIPTWAIARRLEILDLRTNNYFDITDGCYKLEAWGRGI